MVVINTRGFLIAALFIAILTNATASSSWNDRIPLTATKIDIGIMLRWSTSEDLKAGYIVVEKSSNGKDFEVLTEINVAKDKEAENDYSFVDLFPDKHSMYYRLKVIFADGKSTEYQPVKTVEIPRTNFVISHISDSSPNEEWKVNIEAFQAGALVFELTSLEGLIIDKGIKRIKEGYNDLIFQLEGWPNGIYKLTMEMGVDKKDLTIQKIGNSTLQVNKTPK